MAESGNTHEAHTSEAGTLGSGALDIGILGAGISTNANTCTENDTIPIYIVLLPELLMLDVVGPAEVFAYANRYGKNHFKLHFVGPETTLKNSLGMRLTVDPLPITVEPNAWLLVTGMVGNEIKLDTTLMKKVCGWLAQQQFSKVISVCAGALVLAKAGLLNNKKCTTHFMHCNELSALLTAKQVLENRLFVQDGNVYTSAGVSAGIDLALHLVQQQVGPQISAKIARQMVLFIRRGMQDPSLSPYLEHRNHLQQRIHRIQDKIQQDPAKNWSVDELADLGHCSKRHFARIFKDSTGITSKEYIYKLRLSLAQQLLQHSPLQVEEIAQRCGFEDSRQFRRLWARYHNSPPSSYR
ncbi:GlxA family transcriptional regulator [Alteromonas stellipolaris]|uniref:GlxA family transcriptional regulator n=1 Tax=Alteromonas stellipolaris TaxID=233316 RepID=UPI00072224E5|nr:helix-turn-helix domain-containing protein [Alteromonas stellipolaris]ALM89569.1 Transcriptional regulator, AraC [Alteromonas stellipolaris LMG 21856]